MEIVAYSRLIPNSASTPAPPTAEHSAEMRLDVRLKNSRSRNGSDERFFFGLAEAVGWVGMPCNTPNSPTKGRGLGGLAFSSYSLADGTLGVKASQDEIRHLFRYVLRTVHRPSPSPESVLHIREQ